MNRVFRNSFRRGKSPSRDSNSFDGGKYGNTVGIERNSAGSLGPPSSSAGHLDMSLDTSSPLVEDALMSSTGSLATEHDSGMAGSAGISITLDDEEEGFQSPRAPQPNPIMGAKSMEFMFSDTRAMVNAGLKSEAALNDFWVTMKAGPHTDDTVTEIREGKTVMKAISIDRMIERVLLEVQEMSRKHKDELKFKRKRAKNEDAVFSSSMRVAMKDSRYQFLDDEIGMLDFNSLTHQVIISHRWFIKPHELFHKLIEVINRPERVPKHWTVLDNSRLSVTCYIAVLHWISTYPLDFSSAQMREVWRYSAPPRSRLELHAQGKLLSQIMRDLELEASRAQANALQAQEVMSVGDLSDCGSDSSMNLRNKARKMMGLQEEGSGRWTSGMLRLEVSGDPMKPVLMPEDANPDNHIVGGSYLDILNFSNKDIAYQLTLIELAGFQCIPLDEFLKKKKVNGKVPKNKHIDENIKLFNRISTIVAASILSWPLASQRAKVFNRFVKVADEQYKLNNHNGTMAVVSALNHSAVQRMKKTIELVEGKRKKQLKVLTEILGPELNFERYRAELLPLREGIQAVIPFLGMYLHDMVYLDDAIPERTEDGLMNGRKIAALSNMFTSFVQWQRGWQFQPSIESINRRFLEILEIPVDEGLLWDMSVAREARVGKASTATTDIKQIKELIAQIKPITVKELKNHFPPGKFQTALNRLYELSIGGGDNRRNNHRWGALALHLLLSIVSKSEADMLAAAVFPDDKATALSKRMSGTPKTNAANKRTGLSLERVQEFKDDVLSVFADCSAEMPRQSPNVVYVEELGAYIHNVFCGAVTSASASNMEVAQDIVSSVLAGADKEISDAIKTCVADQKTPLEGAILVMTAHTYTLDSALHDQQKLLQSMKNNKEGALEKATAKLETLIENNRKFQLQLAADLAFVQANLDMTSDKDTANQTVLRLRSSGDTGLDADNVLMTVNTGDANKMGRNGSRSGASLLRRTSATSTGLVAMDDNDFYEDESPRATQLTKTLTGNQHERYNDPGSLGVHKNHSRSRSMTEDMNNPVQRPYASCESFPIIEPIVTDNKSNQFLKASTSAAAMSRGGNSPLRMSTTHHGDLQQISFDFSASAEPRGSNNRSQPVTPRRQKSLDKLLAKEREGAERRRLRGSAEASDASDAETEFVTSESDWDMRSIGGTTAETYAYAQDQIEERARNQDDEYLQANQESGNGYKQVYEGANDAYNQGYDENVVMGVGQTLANARDAMNGDFYDEQDNGEYNGESVGSVSNSEDEPGASNGPMDADGGVFAAYFKPASQLSKPSSLRSVLSTIADTGDDTSDEGAGNVDPATFRGVVAKTKSQYSNVKPHVMKHSSTGNVLQTISSDAELRAQPRPRHPSSGNVAPSRLASTSYKSLNSASPTRCTVPSGKDKRSLSVSDARRSSLYQTHSSDVLSTSSSMGNIVSGSKSTDNLHALGVAPRKQKLKPQPRPMSTINPKINSISGNQARSNMSYKSGTRSRPKSTAGLSDIIGAYGSAGMNGSTSDAGVGYSRRLNRSNSSGQLDGYQVQADGYEGQGEVYYGNAQGYDGNQGVDFNSYHEYNSGKYNGNSPHYQEGNHGNYGNYSNYPNDHDHFHDSYSDSHSTGYGGSNSTASLMGEYENLLGRESMGVPAYSGLVNKDPPPVRAPPSVGSMLNVDTSKSYGSQEGSGSSTNSVVEQSRMGRGRASSSKNIPSGSYMEADANGQGVDASEKLKMRETSQSKLRSENTMSGDFSNARMRKKKSGTSGSDKKRRTIVMLNFVKPGKSS